jgi:hypothetical protein
MTLLDRLNQFRFNLETMELLESLGRTRDQLVSELSQLNFTENLVTFTHQSRHLLNSVLLRLQVYGEQNLNEQSVRNHLSVLNNTYVNSLLDYVYENTSLTEDTTPAPPVEEVVTTQPKVETSTSAKTTTQMEESEENQSEENQSEENQSEDPFEEFFTSNVTQTDESTDIVKSSDFYNAFTEWWGDHFEEDVPDKKELKSFLNEKLGKSKKNTWTNVVLNN